MSSTGGGGGGTAGLTGLMGFTAGFGLNVFFELPGLTGAAVAFFCAAGVEADAANASVHAAANAAATKQARGLETSMAAILPAAAPRLTFR